MKTTCLLGSLMLILAVQSCKKDDALPDYQTAIQAKYKALGWTQEADGSNTYTQTAGLKGWVQYYGGKDRAIYYFPNDGDYPGGAFGMLNYEMKKYETLGQDNYGYVASDPGEIAVSSTASVHYNEIVRQSDKTPGVIMTAPAPYAGTYVVAGPIHQEYLRQGRWSGPLGYPRTDELNTQKAGGRYHYFSKTGATIIWSQSTGAHAYWNRVDDLYRAAGYSVGWLGFPKSSCDPNVADNKQQVLFEGGIIQFVTFGTNAYCGRYFISANNYALPNGKAYVSGLLPCY